MFFCTNIIYKPPDQATCPACGQARWESIQWQLGIRYSLWFTMVFIGDAVSLPVLAYMAAEYILGDAAVKTFLFTPLGAICGLVVAGLLVLTAYLMIQNTIETKFWAHRPKQRVRACKCTNCKASYLFIEEVPVNRDC